MSKQKETSSEMPMFFVVSPNQTKANLFFLLRNSVFVDNLSSSDELANARRKEKRQAGVLSVHDVHSFDSSLSNKKNLVAEVCSWLFPLCLVFQK